MLKDLVLETFDMKMFLYERGYRTRYIGSKTQNFLNTCPSCGKDYHCGVNFEKKWFGCYKCHVSGDFIKLLMLVLGKSYFETLEFLKNQVDERHIDIRYIGNVIEEGKKQEELQKRVKPIALPEEYISLQGKEIEYTKGRGITPAQIDYYRMGVCYEGKYKNRLIVCDVNDKREVIYWVARDISGKVHKSYKLLNPPANITNEIGSADLLFNWYLTKNYPCAIVTEGVFDALWIGNNGVATYGYGIKKNHLPWFIMAEFQEVYLMYDADVKDELLERYALMIAQFIPTKICKLPKGDPDEHSREDLKRMLSMSVPFLGGKHIGKLEIEI